MTRRQTPGILRCSKPCFCHSRPIKSFLEFGLLRGSPTPRESDTTDLKSRVDSNAQLKTINMAIRFQKILFIILPSYLNWFTCHEMFEFSSPMLCQQGSFLPHWLLLYSSLCPIVQLFNYSLLSFPFMQSYCSLSVGGCYRKLIRYIPILQPTIIKV